MGTLARLAPAPSVLANDNAVVNSVADRHGVDAGRQPVRAGLRCRRADRAGRLHLHGHPSLSRPPPALEAALPVLQLQLPPWRRLGVQAVILKGLGNESLCCRCGAQRDAGRVSRVCAGPGRRRPGSGHSPAAPGSGRARAARRPRRQPPAPKPFPQGAKVAYVVLQRIANESADGRVATTRIQALQQKKAAELNEQEQAADRPCSRSSRRKAR